MNILFIHEVSWTKKPVFDLHWIAESMSLLGHKVYVLYYDSMWGNGSSQSSVGGRAFSEAKVELISPPFIKMPVVSRVSAFVSHFWAIKRVIEEKRIDAIVLYSVPTNGLQVVYWAKKYNIPVVFRSIDVLNQLVPYRILRPITKWIEKRVYSSVDRIVTITPKLSEYVVNLGADADKVAVLPIPVDIDLFRPSNDANGLRQRWGLGKGDRIILFMGTLFRFCGLYSFVARLPKIIKDMGEVKLLVVGDGEERGRLELLIPYLGLQKHVIMTGFQPYEDIPQYINLADVCVNPFEEDEITRGIFPGKTVQFLACGKPVVMRPLEGVKVLISGEQQGVVYADDDDSIVKEIVWLLKDEGRRHRIGQWGLGYVRKTHDSTEIAERLESELLQVRGASNK